MDDFRAQETIIETAEQVEKWNKILAFISIKMMPLAGVLSRAIPSFFLFYFTDLGNEAFQLPAPMW